MSNEQKMREAFETWAKDKGYPLSKWQNGEYVEPLTLAAYAGWKAREALAKQPATVPERWRKAIEHVVEVWKNSNRYPDEADMPHLNRAINGIEGALIAAAPATNEETKQHLS